MSNKVWVTWTDVERNNLSDKVRGLANSDDVSDLKHAFVKQRQGLNIDPAYVEVREPGKSDILDEEDELKKYFVGTKREIAGPGQSKKTALVLTLPSSSTRTVRLFRILCRMFARKYLALTLDYLSCSFMFINLPFFHIT